MNSINGFLIINKEKGFTSHDYVKQIRKLLKCKRVGHTGTLDPQVTGILPIALGHATRFIQYLPQKKIYIGVIKLGIQTNTDDIHGKIINNRNWPELNSAQLENYLDNFRGTIQQIPPKVSSVHINGERAYKKSFRNENFELSPKEVNISNLKLINWNQKEGTIELRIHCSSGTYIRSIARDLGKLLNSYGCLYKLKRVEASGFDENNAFTLDELKNFKSEINKIIIPTKKALNNLPEYILSIEESTKYWETGRKISIKIQNLNNEKITSNSPIKVVNTKNELLGIGFLKRIDQKDYLQPKLVLNAR